MFSRKRQEPWILPDWGNVYQDRFGKKPAREKPPAPPVKSFADMTDEERAAMRRLYERPAKK